MWVIAESHLVLRVQADESFGRNHQGDNLIARCYQVRLDDVINLGRTLGTIAGNLVIRTVRRAHGLHGSHGDDQRIISRRHDGAVAVVADRVVASAVSRGNHNEDAGAPSCFDRQTERVIFIAIEDGSAERHIDDADVVLRLKLDRAADGGNDPSV